MALYNLYVTLELHGTGGFGESKKLVWIFTKLCLKKVRFLVTSSSFQAEVYLLCVFVPFSGRF